MYLFYEIKHSTTNLHSISESFDVLANEAKTETRKQNTELLNLLETEVKTNTEKYRTHRVEDDEESIEYGYRTFRYQRPDYEIGVLNLPKPIKNGYLYYHVENGIMYIKDVAEQFEDLFEGAKADTVEDVEQFHEDFYEEFEEMFQTEANEYECETWDMGLYANKETKTYTYWSHYDTPYEIVIEPLPKMFKKILL